jgi:hypothetical protein
MNHRQSTSISGKREPENAPNSGLPEFGILSQAEVGNIRLRPGEGARARCWIADENLASRVNNFGY